MKIRFSFTLLLVLFISNFSRVSAQEPTYECGYMHEVEKIMKNKPNYLIWQDAWYKKALDEYRQFSEAKRTVVADTLFLEIPVVFHVLYNKTEENLSDQYILSQLDELNLAFRKLNADTSRIRDIFKHLAADVKIQFVLADRDPSGNPSTGITRKFTNKTTFAINAWGTYNNHMKFNANGGTDAWDPTSYMNIWICNMQYPGGFSITYGFATPPTGAPNWDIGNYTKDTTDPETGVVLHYRIVGRNNPLAPAKYNEGKAAVHEVGHFLGLRHVWGDGSSSSGCTVDDGIFDTPDARLANSSCMGQNSCIDAQNDLPDMTENYMDYALDGCAAMFSRQQAWIMRYVLNNLRTGLPHREINYDTLPGNNPQANDVLIFPNPAASGSVITVRTGTLAGEIYTLSLVDMSGRQLFVRSIKSGKEETIKLDGFATGIYAVTVYDANRKYIIRKLISVF